MKTSLQPGIDEEMSYTVTEDMAPPHLPVKVLGTPTMIQLIEKTCLHAAQPHLDDGETTVGTHVCVSHTGPAKPGDEVRIKVKLTEMKKRRLTFETEVIAPQGTISTGTHERAVVDLARLAGKA